MLNEENYMKQVIRNIKIKDLYLWSENPREPMDASLTDVEVIRRAVEDKNNKWNLPKIVRDMGDHYDFSELPTVVEINGKFIVFDGNRRIAVLKYLQNKKIYQSFGGGLFLENESKDLLALHEIPCNVCDRFIALDNIERKHISNSSWGTLERDYFLHIHKREAKSLFLQFEQLTEFISRHPKLNQRFVKEEVLTENNLKEIGIWIKDGKLFSSNSDEKISLIFNELILAIEDGTIKTRTNDKQGTFRLSRLGGLKDVLEKKSNNLEINPFDTQKAHEKNKNIFIKDNDSKSDNPFVTRKTPRNKVVHDILFGEKLSLRAGSVNNLYSILDDIYNKNKNDKNILPIIGISLRLIMEIAGREYFKKNQDEQKANQDVVFRSFMEVIKKDKVLEKSQQNSLSLDIAETLTIGKFEALIGKYAHANIEYDKTHILSCSRMIGKILTHYFAKGVV